MLEAGINAEDQPEVYIDGEYGYAIGTDYDCEFFRGPTHLLYMILTHLGDHRAVCHRQSDRIERQDCKHLSREGPWRVFYHQW